MRILLTGFLILLFFLPGLSQRKTFIRVYDEQGRKSHKGFLSNLSDSSLFVSESNVIVEIPVRQVSRIRMRRSFGHTVLIGSLLIGGACAAIGAATAEPHGFLDYTAGEGALGGFLFGAGIGGIAGSFAAGTKHRPVFLVNRDLSQWLRIKEVLSGYLHY